MSFAKISRRAATVAASFAFASAAWANVIVVTNTSWTLSTVSVDGGPTGDWTPSGIAAPAAGTFTLGVSAASNTATSAAATMGAGTLALTATGNVHFYRKTFTLDPFSAVSANMSLAVDNDAIIFINGAEIAREVDFDAANWGTPLPSLTINSNGSISNVVKFDATAPFTGFHAGLNDVVVAVRNPNSESGNAGGFAFRMDVATTASAVPEPGSIALLGLGLAGFGLARRKKR